MFSREPAKHVLAKNLLEVSCVTDIQSTLSGEAWLQMGLSRQDSLVLQFGP
jgi:hypothetical protein